jgi:hypothetical protein
LVIQEFHESFSKEHERNKISVAKLLSITIRLTLGIIHFFLLYVSHRNFEAASLSPLENLSPI